MKQGQARPRRRAIPSTPPAASTGSPLPPTAPKPATKYEFGDSSDAPNAIETSVDQDVTWTSTGYLTVPSGGMVASLSGATLTYQLSNLHGDTVAQTSDTTIDSYAETDEYGKQIDPPTGRYGYLGAAKRSTDTVGGLVLMGARLYNPANAQFTSLDPITGGNSTPYAYPQDPINRNDISGRCEVIVVCDLVDGGVSLNGDPVYEEQNKPSWVIGKQGERKAYRRLNRSLGIYLEPAFNHWHLQKHPKRRDTPKGFRYPDIALWADGTILRYYEVKANKARYSKLQRWKDAYIYKRWGIPTEEYRVHIKKTWLECVDNCDAV